ncbi:MCE family protein [Amycolatopsis sp. NPDC049691]|uniref:MCE family protein n=1 Tax=Amycolatopsis sp. NPDC049691 TaxID=3155155 RepID=UPI003414CFB7
MVLTGTLLLSACSGSVYDLPLPGGADLGDHPYEVTVELANALDLVPNNGVRVNDVPVGKVTQVALSPDWTARVTVKLNGDVRLPGNAGARLTQTSLLGEKFVELAAPADQRPTGRLAPGATIPLNRTARNPEVEEILGTLSLLLNGGGVQQVHSIAKELNTALSGNEDAARGVLGKLASLTAELDSQKENIRKSIDGLATLSGSLAGQHKQIDNALVNIQPGVQVLVDQRGQLVDMLTALDHLSEVATDTLGKSKDDLVQDLRSLTPTLQKLAEAGSGVPESLQVLGTFPFTDYGLSVFHGDYGNLNATLNLDIKDILNSLTTTDNPLINLLGLPVKLPNTTGTTGRTPQVPVAGLPGSPPVPAPPAAQNPAGGVNGLLNSLLGGRRP